MLCRQADFRLLGARAVVSKLIEHYYALITSCWYYINKKAIGAN